MASVYRKGNKIYMSWYDGIRGKGLNKSTGLDYSLGNMKIAKKFAEAFQDEIESEIKKIKSIGIIEVTLKEAYQHFLRNNVNKHPKTIYDYNKFYKLFTKDFPENTPCTELKKVNVETWLSKLHSLPYQKNTLFGYCKVLKKFVKFLSEYSYTTPFVLNSDLVIRPEVKPIIVFSEDDTQKMVDGLKGKKDNFSTMMYCFLYTGLRPCDILDWKVEDINLDRRTIQYYSPKIKDYLIIPIHQTLIGILQKRIEVVKEGKIFEYETINNMGKAFRRYIQALGLQGKGYTMRTFRKSFISLAHDVGIDLATVSKLVGHKQITTTQKYYAKIGLSKQTEELSKYKLIATKKKKGKK